jgi:hypothetical protein
MAAGDVPVSHACWALLSSDDRSEYMRLRANFHHGQRISSKDRRSVTFHRELTQVVEFLERSPDNLEARCVLAGVCFAGGFVCVNTRQLKGLLKRCKSSINGSFQQFGYLSLRTKCKAKACLLSVLPSLNGDHLSLRQWAVRVISDRAELCFVTSFSHAPMPEVRPEDLLEESPPPVSAPRPVFRPNPPVPAPPPRSFRPTFLDDDLPSLISDGGPAFGGSSEMPMSQSWSEDFTFRDPDPGWGDFVRPVNTEDELRTMHKSQSAPFGDTWNDVFDMF